jgi:polyhydroxybutyrate depolymerase
MFNSIKKILRIFILCILLFSISVSYAQIETGSFEFEGLTREYIVFLPNNFQPNMPVVINLHGSWPDDAQWMMDYTGMNEVADTAGFISVYPYSTPSRFHANAGIPSKQEPDVNDIGFILALIDTMESLYDIDLNRIYSCGLNYGSFMASELFLQIGDRFAAGARVNGSMTDNQVVQSKLSDPFPVVMFNGTADTYLPYAGGNSPKWGAEQAVSWWVEKNNCSLPADTLALPDIDQTDNCTVEKISYKDSSDVIKVVFYKVLNGGLSWPGAVSDEDYFKPRNNDINAGVEIWNFFKNYELGTPLGSVEESIAKGFSLSQNYPNPFNPTTTIHYTLPEESSVNITIHDILGRKVHEFISLNQFAGNYSIQWDGKDINGNPVSAGIYLYQIKAGDFVQTKKMVLMK